MREDWLTADVARETGRNVRALAGFKPAGIGRDGDRHHDTSVRGDDTCWVLPGEPSLLPVLSAFEGMRQDLNGLAFMGLQGVEVQAARYLDFGAKYERHRDTFRGRRGRRITLLYYLNETWTPPDGGCLRLHLSPQPRDIAPCSDTLVVFLSDEVEHEVLASLAPRWALTAWLS